MGSVDEGCEGLTSLEQGESISVVVDIERYKPQLNSPVVVHSPVDFYEEDDGLGIHHESVTLKKCGGRVEVLVTGLM